MTLTKTGEEGVARISGLEPPLDGRARPRRRRSSPRGPKKVVKTHGKRARVKFRFTSTSAGSPLRVRADQGAHKKGKKRRGPSFKCCKSPKAYSFKPGRYQFKVRALAAGQIDQTPASRSFRVVHVNKR